ncbi:hypothetical protein FPRO04_13273 [Fusarium proliferatum]|nr:hypothetical protein FPRO04_13273 [Fusarium proliferatum]
MAVQHMSQNPIDRLSDFTSQHINWVYAGDVDNEHLFSLLKWANDTTTWRTGFDDDTTKEMHNGEAADEEEMLDYISMRLLKQYSDMNERSPVLTLHFAAKLVQATREYLEDAHLKMHNLLVYQEGCYHRYAASVMSKWADGINGRLMLTKFPDGLIKVSDEHGYAADLFVPANTDFRNNAEMKSRIGEPIQVQWSVRNLRAGGQQAVPDWESVAMPISVWRTIARVDAVLRPHTGRQQKMEGIIKKPRWRSDGHWLELEMEAVFSDRPEADPARELTKEVQLQNCERGLDVRTQNSSWQGPAQLEVEEMTDDEASALVLKWQNEQTTGYELFMLEEVD